VNDQNIDITIQQQPFTFSCDEIEDAYCDNEVVIISLADLVNTDPQVSNFTWFLNGIEISEPFIDVEALDASTDPYVLSYSYAHSTPPNCVFEGQCSFNISALTTPTISGFNALCQGETVELDISGLGGFAGDWEFSSCPGTCPSLFTSDENELSWNTSIADATGEYTISYSGECLASAEFIFNLNELPPFTPVATPLNIICEGETVDLGINYTGSAAVSSCAWSDENGPIANPDCDITVTPIDALTTYSIVVTDDNGCVNDQNIDITIQQQPFTFSCDAIEDAYCDNEVVVITLTDLVNTDPQASNFTWFLNGAEISGPSIDVEALVYTLEGYTLSYEYQHSDSPNCFFEDSCYFFISELTLPTISGTDTICINGEVVLEINGTNGFTGNWTFINCPSDCPTNITSNTNELIWQTDESLNADGTYTVQYTGECLDTALFEIVVFPLPEFSITSDIGGLICEGEEVSLGIDYTGNYVVNSCLWYDVENDNVVGPGDCELVVFPTENLNEYQNTLTDSNGCFATESTEIAIQQLPFTFTSDDLEDVYCDNSEDVIVLNGLLTPEPPALSVQWFLNGSEIEGQLEILSLIPDNYSLVYVYTHTEVPNCEFTDSLQFDVVGLELPTITGQNNYCQGETVDLEAGNLNGFSGTWQNISCPEDPCISEYLDPNNFSWDSESQSLGTYEVQYTGECLDTALFVFTIFGIPEVSWAPTDATPCLNECVELEVTTLETYTNFGWEFSTPLESGDILNNELCLGSLLDPSSVDICLWAELEHPVSDGILTCYIEDCNVVEPIASPGGYPSLPDIACPSELIDLDIDYSLYDGCQFIIGGLDEFADCNSIQINPDWYGTYPDTLFLAYDGCQDTLTSTIWILEPPSFDLTLEYDPCIIDVMVSYDSLSGDSLIYDWQLFDNPGNNYTNLLLESNSDSLPIPNPILFSDLELFSDTTFFISLTMNNICTAVNWLDSVNYISPPQVEIDILAGNEIEYCLPSVFQFEIFEFATNNIDSVVWDFGAQYNNVNLEGVVYDNTLFPPPITYQNIGIVDTVVVIATAYNECGSDADSLTMIHFPPDVFIEMPEAIEGVCPGESITLQPLLIQGDPWGGCEVTSEPLIPGLTYSCSGNVDEIEINIPYTTPPGIYTITTAIFGCGSDLDITTLEIFELPNLSFTTGDIGCAGESVTFTNSSSNISDVNWDFGDPVSGAQNTSTSISPSHTYNAPGTYIVVLSAESPEGCFAQEDLPIEVFGPDPTILEGNVAICSGQVFNMSIVDPGEVVSLQWQFSFPELDEISFVSDYEISHSIINYSDTLQEWNVNVDVMDINGCSAEFNGTLFLQPSPEAFFFHSPVDRCAQGAEIQFTNLSSTNSEYFWDFGDPISGNDNTSNEQHPSHFYLGPGNYNVELFVVNSFNCYASHTELIPCSDYEIYVPNAFTPDGDQTNEVFIPVIDGIEGIKFYQEDDYTFQIFDRWGIKLFETHDPLKPWNGSFQGGEHYCQPDVYIWRVEIEFPSGRSEALIGHVTLVR
jgi:gliding motility-associated-like protein